jgi:glycosyltransferase involved in cell wall biosynthesis
VCSAGIGADWLREQCQRRPTIPLTVLPFQPYERFGEVLGAATLVTALLEPDAGVFSVPSKVLSYMAAGRPILMAAPEVNLAARTIRRENGGTVVAPGDVDGFVATAMNMLRAPQRLADMGARGRTYAETAFDIERIGDRFEGLWSPALRRAA